MPEKPDLDELIARFAAQPPHKADYGRRQLIRNAAKFGLGAAAMASLTRHLAFAPAAAAEAVKLPELTSVPDKLKGSGVVRVCSWGGALQAAQRKAYLEPFERLCGVKVIESEGPDAVKVKAMVDTKNVEYDVGEFDRADIYNLEKKGDYWEAMDWSLFDTGNIPEHYRYKYCIDMLPYGEILAYRTDAFGGKKPTGWKDFWDVKGFPGGRAMTAGTDGLVPELECAVIAAGKSKDSVYPIDVDAAYKKLAELKPSVIKWWTAGAQPAQMLTDKELPITTAWNGRVFAIQQKGVPAEVVWNEGMLKTDVWAIPKGSANAANAQKLCAFITLAVSQARCSMQIPYGYVNTAATEYIPAERLKVLPTAPDIAKQMFVYNSKWWADNEDDVLKKWANWVLE